jgi:hypothetical protein
MASVFCTQLMLIKVEVFVVKNLNTPGLILLLLRYRQSGLVCDCCCCGRWSYGWCRGLCNRNEETTMPGQ